MGVEEKNSARISLNSTNGWLNDVLVPEHFQGSHNVVMIDSAREEEVAPQDSPIVSSADEITDLNG